MICTSPLTGAGCDKPSRRSIRANFIHKDNIECTYKRARGAYRVVLRGLHCSKDTELIKLELSELGHEVRQAKIF